MYSFEIHSINNIEDTSGNVLWINLLFEYFVLEFLRVFGNFQSGFLQVFEDGVSIP